MVASEKARPALVLRGGSSAWSSLKGHLSHMLPPLPHIRHKGQKDKSCLNPDSPRSVNKFSWLITTCSKGHQRPLLPSEGYSEKRDLLLRGHGVHESVTECVWLIDIGCHASFVQNSSDSIKEICVCISTLPPTVTLDKSLLSQPHSPQVQTSGLPEMIYSILPFNQSVIPLP